MESYQRILLRFRNIFPRPGCKNGFCRIEHGLWGHPGFGSREADWWETGSSTPVNPRVQIETLL